MRLPKLVAGVLIRRYNRFLADVRLADGDVVTAHCPNSGSMKTCVGPGWPVLLSESPNPNRRCRYTWELVHNGSCWIGINTMRPNRLAAEAIRADKIPELSGYSELRGEVPYGRNSRIDLLLSGSAGHCYVEVKNVTLVGPDGVYCFPDAITERGRKHLRELTQMRRRGHRAVMLFVVQRADGTHFRPAWEIDPAYGGALRRAHRAGVEILVYQARVTPTRIVLAKGLEWTLDRPKPRT